MTASKLESVSGGGKKYTVGLGFLSHVEAELYLIEGLNSNHNPGFIRIS
jgi:hypothetical protein